MKTLTTILIFIALSTQACNAQDHSKDYSFAVPSVNKDTLYVLDNEMGDLVIEIWQTQPVCCGFVKTPVIQNVENITPHRQRYIVSLVDLSEMQ